MFRPDTDPSLLQNLSKKSYRTCFVILIIPDPTVNNLYLSGVGDDDVGVDGRGVVLRIRTEVQKEKIIRCM